MSSQELDWIHSFIFELNLKVESSHKCEIWKYTKAPIYNLLTSTSKSVLNWVSFFLKHEQNTFYDIKGPYKSAYIAALQCLLRLPQCTTRNRTLPLKKYYHMQPCLLSTVESMLPLMCTLSVKYAHKTTAPHHTYTSRVECFIMISIEIVFNDQHCMESIFVNRALKYPHCKFIQANTDIQLLNWN